MKKRFILTSYKLGRGTTFHLAQEKDYIQLESQTQTINHQPSTTQQPPAVAVAPQQSRVLPYVNFAQREQNRSLSTGQVLDLLRQWLPDQFHLAEIVGKWIWITFPEPPAEKIRGQLSQFGFHWNNHRKCWQHPCGQFATEGSGTDPRTKYGSHPATELKAA